MVSLIGKEFTPADLPRNTKLKTDEAKEAWAASQTARYKVVAVDPGTGRKYIAEDVQQGALNMLSDKARRVAGGMLFLDPAVRREILGVFDAAGALIIPFDRVE
jgi:hypothetical protein